MDNWDEAIECFQKSAKPNPSHSSTYLALGRTLSIIEQNIPTLLSYLRFHIIEPDSPRAKKNFELIHSMQSASDLGENQSELAHVDRFEKN
ncbi:hypothetical protein N9515_02565 [Vicingaceae bacterium]|nr:hypothetical protein [Vicingaceae bacterium]MDB4060825.1 hypothetical protein [Vicingaceae bacterium]